jgi:hypothetical protein
MVLTISGAVLAVVAVVIGPVIQHARFHQLVYGLPLAPALASALLLMIATLTRRVPLVVASVTISASAVVAAATGPLHYPLGIVADVFLLAGATVLLLAARRRTPEIVLPFPPPPGPPAAPFGAAPFGAAHQPFDAAPPNPRVITPAGGGGAFRWRR